MRRTNQRKPRQKHVGEIRTSQLVTSYGVGAMVDFKEESVILAEADGWLSSKEADKKRIIHCRSLEKVLEKKYFVTPKWDPSPHPAYESKDYKSRDIAAYRFPTILYCPNCKRLVMSQTLAGNRSSAPKCRAEDCTGSRLVPSRFIVACPRGHLDDFPYDAWVHRGTPCPGRSPEGELNLKLKNVEGRNSISSLTVFCDDCGAYRSMQDALTAAGLKSVYTCTGRRPWLKIEYDKKPCAETPVTKLRTAAGVYMPATVSALNLPAWTTKIHQVLQSYMDALEDRTEEQALEYINKKIVPSLHDVDGEEILSVWKQMEEDAKTKRPRNEQELYEDEYAVLCEESEEQDFEEDDEDQELYFYTEEQEVPVKYSGLISRICAVPRLTEAVVMLGFTRLHSWNGDYRSSALAPIFSQTEREWLPAVELQGEGIFIELKEEKVQKWEEENKGVYEEMLKAAENSRFREENASPRYVLLHTLAHLLIRALSVNCG